MNLSLGQDSRSFLDLTLQVMLDRLKPRSATQQQSYSFNVWFGTHFLAHIYTQQAWFNSCGSNIPFTFALWMTVPHRQVWQLVEGPDRITVVWFLTGSSGWSGSGKTLQRLTLCLEVSIQQYAAMVWMLGVYPSLQAIWFLGADPWLSLITSRRLEHTGCPSGGI